MINNKIDQILSKFGNKFEQIDHKNRESLFISISENYINMKNSL